jgi:hypothetical protein
MKPMSIMPLIAIASLLAGSITLAAFGRQRGGGGDPPKIPNCYIVSDTKPCSMLNFVCFGDGACDARTQILWNCTNQQNVRHTPVRLANINEFGKVIPDAVAGNNSCGQVRQFVFDLPANCDESLGLCVFT